MYIIVTLFHMILYDTMLLQYNNHDTVISYYITIPPVRWCGGGCRLGLVSAGGVPHGQVLDDEVAPFMSVCCLLLLLLYVCMCCMVLSDEVAPGQRSQLVADEWAAAKVMNFDRSGKKVRPGTLGKIKVGSRECPKSPSVKKHEIRSDPISADPVRPFPRIALCIVIIIVIIVIILIFIISLLVLLSSLFPR